MVLEQFQIQAFDIRVLTKQSTPNLELLPALRLRQRVLDNAVVNMTEVMGIDDDRQMIPQKTTFHSQPIRPRLGLSLLDSLTARAKINPPTTKGIFEDFGVAEVTKAILATEDPVAVLATSLATLLELLDDRQTIGNSFSDIGLAREFEEGGS
jgi:hypothetical protein